MGPNRHDDARLGRCVYFKRRSGRKGVQWGAGCKARNVCCRLRRWHVIKLLEILTRSEEKQLKHYKWKKRKTDRWTGKVHELNGKRFNATHNEWNKFENKGETQSGSVHKIWIQPYGKSSKSVRKAERIWLPGYYMFANSNRKLWQVVQWV